MCNASNNTESIERQARLKAWLFRNSLTIADVARSLGFSRVYVGLVFSGDRKPAGVIGKLIEYGIPPDLLPEPQDLRLKSGAASTEVEVA